jgi:N-acetylglucosaminyldiphosphoundecaprenol N-acetyl-beta-D-mannosaminyltransferase
LSTPKQEKWAAEFHKRLNVKMIITVGAAFDFHTDEIKFAPQWLCKFGLEWLFRLLSEPRRLLPRYFEIVPKFLFLALLQLLGIKNFNQKKG